MTDHRPQRQAYLEAARQRHALNPPPPLTAEQQAVIREAFRVEPGMPPRQTPQPSDDASE